MTLLGPNGRPVVSPAAAANEPRKPHCIVFVCAQCRTVVHTLPTIDMTTSEANALAVGGIPPSFACSCPGGRPAACALGVVAMPDPTPEQLAQREEDDELRADLAHELGNDPLPPD